MCSVHYWSERSGKAPIILVRFSIGQEEALQSCIVLLNYRCCGAINGKSLLLAYILFRVLIGVLITVNYVLSCLCQLWHFMIFPLYISYTTKKKNSFASVQVFSHIFIKKLSSVVRPGRRDWGTTIFWFGKCILQCFRSTCRR